MKSETQSVEVDPKTMESLEKLVEKSQSQNDTEKLQAIIAIRKLLSSGKPPTEALVDLGVIPVLARSMDAEAT